jgi:hypothetical protein
MRRLFLSDGGNPDKMLPIRHQVEVFKRDCGLTS